jgi:hypothetical protein
MKKSPFLVWIQHELEKLCSSPEMGAPSTLKHLTAPLRNFSPLAPGASPEQVAELEEARDLTLRVAQRQQPHRRAYWALPPFAPAGDNEAAHWGFRALKALQELHTEREAGKLTPPEADAKAENILREASVIALLQNHDDPKAKGFVRACFDQLVLWKAWRLGLSADDLASEAYKLFEKRRPDLYKYRLPGSFEQLSMFVWLTLKRIADDAPNKLAPEKFRSKKTVKRYREELHTSKLSAADVRRLRDAKDRSRRHQTLDSWSVNEVADSFLLRPQVVAQWVRVLRKEGRIEGRADRIGKMKVFRLSKQEVEELRHHGESTGRVKPGFRSHVYVARSVGVPANVFAEWINVLRKKKSIEPVGETKGKRHVFWLDSDDLLEVLRLGNSLGDLKLDLEILHEGQDIDPADLGIEPDE